MWRKIRGGGLVALGYMLSPLSWWNDLIFNLPIAYGFGWLFGLLSPAWILPMTVVGYWISNLLGILMMQWGATDVLKSESEGRWQRDLLIGVASSTVYTLVIVGLVQFHVVDISSLFPMLG